MRPDYLNMPEEAKRILNWDVSITSKMIAEQFPVAWKRMDTHTIDSPAGYYSFKALATSLASGIVEAENSYRTGKGIESNIGVVAGAMETHDFPTYYVAPALLDALKHTDPPIGSTWASLKLPYPAAYFMVPRGSMIEPEPTCKEIIGIGYAFFPKGVPMPIPTSHMG